MSHPVKMRFLREYRGRQPGAEVLVDDWGFGVCQALVHRHIAEFDTIEAAVPPTTSPTLMPSPAAETESKEDRKRRHKGNG